MGSVGEPRHGRPNATYVIYDTDTEKVTLREVEYNYQKTCDPIGEATQLIEKYGADAVQQLWDSVSRKTVEWIRSLDFGFFELDCLLIHGSSLSVDDELTPQTPPWQMCDRLMRMGANNLFCGRSGLTFEYEKATYTLYDPDTNRVEFRTVRYGMGKGFEAY